jgi:hypothetical protein
MAEPGVFERACEELARATSLDDLSARGTIRIALKSAGLDARGVTGEQMAVVIRKVLPGELASRGVADAERICGELATRVQPLGGASAGAGSSVEDVFRRLGGR